MAISQQFRLKPQMLMDMDALDARLILAARSFCILRGARQDPMPRLRAHLPSAGLAMRFVLLMDVVQQIWPEPFTIHRPCCPNASLDEALLGSALQYARANARPAFDSLFREMLGDEARDLLYVRARMLYR